MIELPLRAKRYEGGTGSTIVTGCVPLRREQLVETGIAGSPQSSVSLWQGATEIGAHFTCLYPQHQTEPASVKSLMVSAALDLDSATQPAEGVPLTLKLGAPRAAPGPSAHPTIDRMWMKFPRLLGCDDPAHMCAADIAFGPLVPVNDPRLSVNWQKALTDELENGYAPGGNVHLGQSGFPTLKHHLDRLHALGDMGVKLCLVTPGSPILKILDLGWPLPTSAPTAQLSPGMRAGCVSGALTVFNTTILSVDSPDQVTLNAPASASFAPSRAFTVGFGPGLLYRDANYNLLAVFYYRYLTAVSGHLDKYRDALLASVTRSLDVVDWIGRSNPTETSIGVANHGDGSLIRYAAPYTDGEGVAHATDEIFAWDEYGQVPHNPSPQGSREDLSGFHHGAYMTYVLSGWRQALGNCIAWGIGELRSNASYAPFPGHPWPNIKPAQVDPVNQSFFHSPSQQGNSGARLACRLRREADAFLFMLSLPMDLRGGPTVAGTAVVAPSPRNPVHRAKWLDYFQRKYYDSIAEWSLEFPETGSKSSFLRGKWGFSAWYKQYADTEPEYVRVNGTCPLFQLITTFTSLLLVYRNIKEDPRFVPKMGELAAWIAEEQIKRVPAPATFMNVNAAARAENPPGWWLPYRATDPALLESPPVPTEFFGINMYTPGILVALFAWAAAATGNARCLEMADGHCSTYSWSSNPANTSAGGGAYEWSVKGDGEKLHMLHYAAGFRALIGGTPPPPLPPSPPAALRVLQAAFNP